MVHARDNFQRLYDLRERVIPESAALPVPDKAETQDFIVRRAVGSLGVVPESQVVWWRSARAGDAAVARATEAGLITPVELGGAKVRRGTRGLRPWNGTMTSPHGRSISSSRSTT
ncbi:MAG: DNA glycosylase AlkZ-like family protein [Anaerolineae bacterium]